MKKLLLSLTLLALLAGSAAAVDIGSKRPGGSGPRDVPSSGRMGGSVQGLPGSAAPDGEEPVRPVPEPGTMALASMGLIALGAAARKRRK